MAILPLGLVILGILGCASDEVAQEPPDEASLAGRSFRTSGMEEHLATARGAKGKMFLEENRAKPGVKTRRSGLQVMVLEPGDGEQPRLGDIVTTHYRVSSIDGEEYDNSEEYGGPQDFRVDKVIAGWREALQDMKVGARWKLFVPPELAYGDRGMAQIPGSETLIYELELLGVKRAESGAKPPSPAIIDPLGAEERFELSGTEMQEPGSSPGRRDLSLDNLDLLD